MVTIMSLNLWCGGAFDALMPYLKKQAAEVDVFCFQEVYHTPCGNNLQPHPKGARTNLFRELEVALPSHHGYFFPAVQDMKSVYGDIDYTLSYGLATFVRRSSTVESMGATYVHSHPSLASKAVKGSAPRQLAHVTISMGDAFLTIGNFHGTWNGKGKTDTPERIRQSQAVKTALRMLPERLMTASVLVGDFNILPDTESFRILAYTYRDLIQEYGVTSTRSRLYDKYVSAPLYADYALVSHGLQVHDFHVPYVEVSDHLPLILSVG